MGNNGQILFALHDGKSFGINKNNGTISVATKLHKSDAGPLKIIAYNEERYTNNTLKNQTLSITIHIKVFNSF